MNSKNSEMAVGTSLVTQREKSLPAMQETWFYPWVGKIPWRMERLIPSSTLAWRIPWTEKPGRLQSMGSQRVRSDCTDTHTHNSGRWKRGGKWQRIIGKAGQDVNKLAGNVKGTGPGVNLETHQKDHLDSSLRHWGRKRKGCSDQQLIGFPKSTQFY